MNNIVLYQPEIPQNTGNIMRTCVATNTRLHLIKPLGFKIDDASLKRSGVNYIDKLEFFVYENFEEFKEKNKYSGLNEMKLGYNASAIEYIGEFDLIINKTVYNIYKKRLDKKRSNSN